jgi:hypothetical protein
MTGVVLALVGALTAGSFAARLWRHWGARRRDHALAWALSLTLYAVGMVALAAGLLWGWGAMAFGLYWLTGALVNVPLLAVGQMHLLAPSRRRLWWAVAAVAIGWATVATLASRFDGAALSAATAGGGIPVGVDVLGGQPAYAALQPLTLTGTAVVLAGTVWSAVTAPSSASSRAATRWSKRCSTTAPAPLSPTIAICPARETAAGCG